MASDTSYGSKLHLAAHSQIYDTRNFYIGHRYHCPTRKCELVIFASAGNYVLRSSMAMAIMTKRVNFHPLHSNLRLISCSDSFHADEVALHPLPCYHQRDSSISPPASSTCLDCCFTFSQGIAEPLGLGFFWLPLLEPVSITESILIQGIRARSKSA